MKTSSDALRNYKYLDLVMAGFVCVILCANFIGPAKVCTVFGFNFAAGNLFFPISYIFGDILTEVYGYARTRRVIWAGFGAMIFASFMSWVIVNIPSSLADDYQVKLQPALELVFGSSPRIVAASIVAFWVGEFVNSFVMAKMKIMTQGKNLWMRTIGSTFAGQFADSIIFYPLAFLGIWSSQTVMQVLIFNLIVKVSWEALCTPITYVVVNRLKKAEHEDYYDKNTNFTPFSLESK